MKEVEVKAVLKNPGSVIQKLQELGCEISEPMSQRDRKFLPKGMPNSDKILPGSFTLRIRDQDGKFIFTLKKAHANELDCTERETIITNPEHMVDILDIMGFEEVVKINKTRRKCRYNGLEICIDNVEGLGDFIEVEKMTEEKDGLKVQQELFDFLKTLGVEDKDRVVNGYDTLMYYKSIGSLPSNINPQSA